MEFEQVIRLVEAVSKSGLTDFDYEEGNLKLHMGKKGPKAVKVTEIPMVESHETAAVREIVNVEAGPEEKTSDHEAVIASPIVGVFYTSPGPDSEPFVKVGDRIQEGQTIGIVEAMKLMNEIESDVSGVVTEVLAADGEGVEYGQPLIRGEK